MPSHPYRFSRPQRLSADRPSPKHACLLQGSTLTCPSAGFQVEENIPAGYLDGLTCQSTDSNGNIIQIPLAQVMIEI